jgi:hypothetical protein
MSVMMILWAILGRFTGDYWTMGLLQYAIIVTLPNHAKLKIRLIGLQAQDAVVGITLTHVSPETVRHMHHEQWGTSQCCTVRVGLSALVHCWC